MTRRAPARSGTSRATWIAGTAGIAAVTIAAILLLKEKSANAAPALPPTTSYTPLQQAAINVNNAIASDNYVQSDVPVYKAFQQAAGITVDGWPGQQTYNAAMAALASINPPVAPSSNWNPAYTFSPSGGFNGTTAPTVDQWFGTGYNGSTTMSADASNS